MPDSSSRLDPARRRALMLCLVAVLLGLVIAAGPLHRTLIGWLAGVGPILAAHPIGGAALLVVLAAASAMLAFFSSAVLVPAALQAWSPPVVAALLWLGWILGGAVAYGIAKYLGRAAIRSLASTKALGRYEAVVSAKSSFGIVLLFQLAVPSEIPGYVFGLARLPFARFLGALALAELPYALATVYAGSAFMERRLVPLVMLMALTAVVGVASFRALHRRAREESAGVGSPPP